MAGIMLGRLWRGAIAVALLTGLTLPVLAAAPQYSYTYQKRPIPLLMDTSRIAVFQAVNEAARGVARPGVGADLAPFGLQPELVKPLVVNGWSSADTGAMARGVDATAEVENLVARIAAAGAADFVSPVFLNEQGPVIVTRDLLIGFEPDVTRAEADQVIADMRLGEIIDRDFQGMRGVYRVRSASRNGLEALNRSNEASLRPEVRFAEPDLMMTTIKDVIPNDTNFPTLWGLHNTGQSGGVANVDMNGPEAWDITTGTPSVVVVVIDDGCELTHPDLNLAPGTDQTGNGTNGGHFNSCDQHGTAVSGCISAKINNALGVVGIAPNCRVAPAKFSISNVPCDGSGSFQISWMTGCISFAQSTGAKVTNCSNGFGQSGAIDSAYTTAHSAGVVHFASAGNSGAGTIGYPSSSPDVNSVAAMARTGVKASFSQFGPGLDFSAPGQSIGTTDRLGAAGFSAGDYATVDGTSFSSPYAAGVAALVFSKNNFLTAAQVESIMQANCTDYGSAGYDTIFGFGMVNAFTSVSAAPSPAPPGPFNLQAPSDLATNVIRLPTFMWSPSQYGTSYHLLADNDPGFGSPEIDNTGPLTSYVHSGTPLAAATTYYWKVQASNTLGNADSTPLTFSFTTITVPPGSFTLTLPADGATNTSLTPTLSWASAPLAETYHLVVDDDPGFGSPTIDTVTAVTSFSPITPLLQTTLYYWKVQAMNPIGSTDSTPLSRQFTTIGAPPLAFNLLSPPDGPNVPTRTPTLMWSASSGADTYTVEIDDDLNFVSREVNQSGVASTSYTVPAGVLSNGVRYYWRITAVNTSGSIGSTPSAFSFGVLVPLCNGDANSDGSVNFADISSVFANYLVTYPPGVFNGAGDANHDRTVNFVDVTTVFGNWLGVCP